MERIEGVSFITKDYLFELMHVIINTDKVDRLQRILRRIEETAFIDIAFDLPAVKKYKRFFEKIVEFRLKGYSSTAIKESLEGSSVWSSIHKEIVSYLNGRENHIVEDSILETFEKKLKAVHILDFLFKYARLNTEIKDNDEVLNQLIKEINTLYRNIVDASEFIERDYTDVKNIDKRYRDRLLKLSGKSHIKVFSTGLNLLDSIFRTKRGMESGELYIVGAPYGMGKTRFVVRLGTNMYLNGANVYHITIENKMEDIEELYDTALTGIPPEHIYAEFKKSVKGKNLTEKELIKLIEKTTAQYKEKLKQIYDRDNQIYIKKYHPYRVSVNDIRAWIAAKIQETGNPPDVIIVDHMDILVPSIKSRGEMSLFQKGEIIAGELKTLAEQFNAIVLTPTQMNREGVKGNASKKNNTEIGGESTSRSMAKNELTGFLMTLNQTREEALHGYMRLFIDKNRIGIDKVTIPIKFDKATLQVEPITDDTTLLNFNETVRLSVKYLLDRYNDREDEDFDIHTSPTTDTDIELEESVNEKKEYYFTSLKEFTNKVQDKIDANTKYDIKIDDKKVSIVVDNETYAIDKELVIERRDKILNNEKMFEELKQKYPLLHEIMIQTI